MKVFKNAWFGRFARKENISAEALWDAVARAEKGLVDNLGIVRRTDSSVD